MVTQGTKTIQSLTQIQKKAFENMINGKRIPVSLFIRMALGALWDPFRFVVMYMPGQTGCLLRRLYLKRKLHSIGQNVLIDEAVRIYGHENISIGDSTRIDARTTLEGALGSIKIGSKVHIGSSVIIGSGGVLEIHDYVTIGARCKIYSQSEIPIDGKRTSGPMIPWEHKGYKTAPVIIEKKAILGPNCVILPGVRIGEGAIVEANSVVTKNVQPWTISAGVPLKFVSKRDQNAVQNLSL